MKTIKRTVAVAVFLAVGVLASVTAGQQKFPWMKAPGPIEGRWKVSCDELSGMVLEFQKAKPGEVSGAVLTTGKAARRGYQKGEEIFKLTANDFGAWVGKHKWRAVTGVVRWDPVYFIATTETLDATMTTEHCWKKMGRSQ